MNQKTLVTVGVIVAAGAVAFYFYRKSEREKLQPVERAPLNGNINARNNGVAATIGAVGQAITAVGGIFTGTKQSFESMEGIENTYGGF